MAKVTATVRVWTTTVGAAIEGQHPIPIVLGSRRANVNFNLGCGGGVGGHNAFL